MLLLPLLTSVALAGSPEPSAVVGGSTPDEGAWPQTAAFVYGGGFVACSGVLIHPEWVLTAGHCAPNPTAVYLDTVDLEAPGEQHQVADFYVYPESFVTFDVALARLETPSSVPPAHLALDCIGDDWLRPEAAVTVAGFGAIDAFATENATELQVADTVVVDPSCNQVNRGCNAAAMPAGELIAGGEGVDSCTGDSGGPLFLWAADKPWLAGVTSRAALPNDQPCGDGGIYVRADAIAEWIEQTAGIALDRPNCDGLNRPPTLDLPARAVAPMNGQLWLEPVVDDVNLGQSLSLSIRTQPEHGFAGVDGDRILYVPGPSYYGADSLQVEVTDDGVPAESTTATVQITVTSLVEARQRGCQQVPGAPLAWWPLLLLGLRRR